MLFCPLTLKDSYTDTNTVKGTKCLSESNTFYEHFIGHLHFVSF